VLTPHTTITSGAFSSPVGIGLDRSGNLWVADDDNDELYMFTSAQLTAGGSQSSTVTIGSAPLDAPEPLIFDKSGSMWVGNNVNGSNALAMKFTQNQLTMDGSPTPAVTLSPTTVTNTSAQSLDGVGGLVLDKKGNLWVTNFTSDQRGSIAQFSNNDIGADGTPQPTIFIDSDAGGSNVFRPFFCAFGPKVP